MFLMLAFIQLPPKLIAAALAESTIIPSQHARLHVP